MTSARDQRFTFLMSVEERELLEQAAERCGIDKSTYVRLRLFRDERFGDEAVAESDGRSKG